MTAEPPETAETAGAGRGTGLIGAAVIASSALGFLLLSVLARWLPPATYATFLSVWGLVFGLGSAVGAIEPELARQATRARLAGSRPPAAAFQITGIALAAGLTATAVVALVPAGRAALGGSVTVAVLAVVAVAGFVGQFLLRGLLLGAGRAGAYGYVIVAEAALRMVLAGVLVVATASPSLPWATAVIVIGCYGWLPLAVPVLRSVSRDEGRVSWGAAAHTVTALGCANALSALVLTAFPTLVTAVVGSASSLATLFVVVTLARLPLVALSPVQAMAVPIATGLVHGGRPHVLLGLVLRLCVAAVAAAAVLGAAGWWLGPWAVRLLFGASYDAPPAMVAWALASSCLVAGALLHAAVLIAVQRYWLVVALWAAGAGAAVLGLLLTPGPPDQRGLVAFVVAGSAAWLCSAVLVVGAARGIASQEPAGADPAG